MGLVATKILSRRESSVASCSRDAADGADGGGAAARGRVRVASSKHKRATYRVDGGAAPDGGAEASGAESEAAAAGERDAQTARKVPFLNLRSTGSIRPPAAEQPADGGAPADAHVEPETEGSWVSNPSSQPSQQGSPVRRGEWSVLRRAQSRPIASTSGGNPNSSGTFLSFGFRGGARKPRSTSESAEVDNVIELSADYVKHTPKVRPAAGARPPRAIAAAAA